MLTISGARQRLCDGLSRREFLKVGALGVGGLTLADLLRLRGRGGQHHAGKADHHGLSERRPQPCRSVRPEARRSRRISRRVQADQDQCPRHGHLRADALAGEDRRQAGHHPQHEVRAAGPHAAGVVHRLPERQSAVDRLGGEQAAQRRRHPRRLAALRLPRRRQLRRPSRLPRQGSRSVHPRLESHEPRPGARGARRALDRPPPTAAFIRRAPPRPRRCARQHGRHGRLHVPGAGNDRQQQGARRL